MFKELNKYIAKKDLNCTQFASIFFPEIADLLLKYGNPEDKDFNIKRANKEIKEKLIEIKEAPLDTLILVSFETNLGTSAHVGVLYNNYVYHYTENRGIVAEDINNILDKNVNYHKIKLYKVKEITNDNNN